MPTAEDTGQSDIDTPYLTFELNGLYILLSDRGDKSYTFHWRLYLHQSPTSGSIYHLLNDIDPTIWRFEHLPDQTVIYDPSLLGALKIGVLDPTLHAHFLERLHQIPLVDSVRFRERITCRVWLKEALSRAILCSLGMWMISKLRRGTSRFGIRVWGGGRCRGVVGVRLEIIRVI